MEKFVWLIPFLPIFAASWIGIGYLAGKNRGETGEKHTALAATIAISLSFLLILLIDLYAIIYGSPGQLQVGNWLQSGNYRILLSFTLDTFGLVMMTLVASISLLTIRFSVNYMHREAGYQRFFISLCLFSGAMLLIVSAGNAALTFAGWELAGMSSYLLIAYAYDRPASVQNATRAFITNRIGDASFLTGIYLAYFWLGDIEWPVIVGNAHQLNSLNADIIVACFLIAALAKSAQGPFATWIARALEGPTPSSAVFYGSLMVHAGVYLIIRLQPLFEQAPTLMVIMAVIGFITALYGFFSGLVQADIKSSLIFSTTSQVGLMFFSCGMGWFELASWHLVLHAMWRAYQFLSAPGLMHFMARPARPVPLWLKRSKWLYTASLQRFWLEHMTDWLIIKPVRALAQDTQTFDERVVNRIIGLPNQTNAIASIADWEKRKGGSITLQGSIGQGQGFFGKFMEWVASSLHWFEEHLILKSSGEGLLKVLRNIGFYLLKVEDLLSHPRYLILIILPTFIVIL